MLSRLLFGARISLSLGFIAVLLSVTLGTVVGLSAGYFGRAIDSVLMRAVDVLLAFPSLFLILIQLVSGVFMLFFYTPEPDKALQSIEYLSNEVTLGWLFRNMHRWVSSLLLATVFSHMVIVFYLKAYQSPRQLTWLSGSTCTFISSRLSR